MMPRGKPSKLLEDTPIAYIEESKTAKNDSKCMDRQDYIEK